MKNKSNDYESDILKSFENGEWTDVKNMRSEINKHKEYAKETFKKNKRVNIRLSQKDINLIKVRAMEEGIPYQTLMASILHKFATKKIKVS